MSSSLSPADFTAAMARLGPFEPHPTVVVAVSGGADSMALALLAAHWVHDRGGRLLAVTVDHLLRPDSTSEATQVGSWLASHGIAHAILTWVGPKPQADIQGAARAARYRLIEEYCRQNGVLHVLLGHHRDDQAETLLMRLARGSGADGLGAMAPVRETAGLRWLRPLLDQPKARLVATLRARDQDWVEDPSNHNPRHARVRMRQLAPVLATEGLSSARLAATARRLTRVRQSLERGLADVVLDHVRLDPAGFAEVAVTGWSEPGDELALRLLAGLVRLMGGDDTVPRLERSERLLARLRRGEGGTLGGARLVPAGPATLICREAGRVAPPLALVPGGSVRWDGRFRVETGSGCPPGLSVGALGPRGWRQVAAKAARRVPAQVRPGLLAIFDQDGIFAVPHLGYNRTGATVAFGLSVWPAARSPLTAPDVAGVEPSDRGDDGSPTGVAIGHCLV